MEKRTSRAPLPTRALGWPTVFLLGLLAVGWWGLEEISSRDEDCRANAEALETRLHDGHFTTRIRVELEASEPCWVYCRYEIRYRDGSGEVLIEPGSVREVIAPGVGFRLRRDLPLRQPEEVLGVEVKEAGCSPLREAKKREKD